MDKPLRKCRLSAIIASMTTKFHFRVATVLVVVLLLTTLALAQKKGARPARAAPPKTFDDETNRLFGKDPLTLLKGERPSVSGQRPPTGGNPNNTGGPNVVGPTAGGDGWARLISDGSIADEIKSYRLPAAESTKSPGVFKGGGNRKLRNHYGVVAAMFAITAEYPSDVRWKEVASGARDAFARAARNAKAADSNTFKESKARSDDLDLLVNGEKVEFQPGAAEFVWSEICERRAIMKRFKLAQNDRIKQWTANKAEFDRNRDNIVFEAEIIAALSEVIQKEEYEYYDDEDYLAFCKQMQRHALGVRQAATDNNLAEVQRAAGELTKTCSACHEGYK
jgi:hypothetical protein